MEAPRLFSRDEEAGITKWWHYDPDTDTATIQTQQDVTSIIAANKAAYESHDSTTRYGEWTHMARIPLAIYTELLMSGKIYDQAYMRRWLNDPELKKFRVRPGRMSGKIGA